MSLLFGWTIQSLIHNINSERGDLDKVRCQRNNNTKQIKMIEKSQASMKSMSDNSFARINSIFSTALNDQLNKSQQKVTDLGQKYNDAYQDAYGVRKVADPDNDKLVKEANKAYTQAQQDAINQSSQLQQKNQMFQAGMIAAQSAKNNIFSSMDEATVDALKSQDEELQQEQTDLEADLERDQQDLKNTKEAQKEAIKEEAPTFGQ